MKDLTDGLSGLYKDTAAILNCITQFANGGFAMPVYPIASITSGTTYPGHGNALDFATSQGTPIVSATGGTVVQVDWGYADSYKVKRDTITLRDGSEQTGYYEVNAKGDIKYDSLGNAIIGKPYANTVKIKTGDGAILTYAHMSYSDTPPVNKGDTVTAGSQIGTIGNTGNSWGALGGYHLHFEASNTTNSVSDYLPK